MNTPEGLEEVFEDNEIYPGGRGPGGKEPKVPEKCPCCGMEPRGVVSENLTGDYWIKHPTKIEYRQQQILAQIYECGNCRFLAYFNTAYME